MRPAFKSVGRPSKLRQTSSGQEHRGRGGGVQQQQHLICYDQVADAKKYDILKKST